MSVAARITRGDALLALGCGAVSIGSFAAVPLDSGSELSVVGPDELGWWLVVGVLAAQAALLPGVRRAPRAVLVALAAAAPLAALAGAGDASSITSIAVICAVYLAATTRPLGEIRSALVTAGLLLGVGTAAGLASVGAPTVEVVGASLLQAVGTIGLTLLVAVFVTTRRDAARARQAQLLAAEREQQAHVDAAIARERTAMARELHDIAAHHLSGIAVMTAAIGRQIDTDPAGAKAAVQQVREQSTAVLRDLRSLVGLLREGDPAGDVRPETLAGVGALVADATRSGRPVELTVLSDRTEPGAGIGPLAQLAAYRAVQEALANAARHAPGTACRVTVDDRDVEAVVVSVRNEPSAGGRLPAARDGFGLIGMRERAELTGARLEAGPTDDGGWLVSLRLPREQEAT